MMPKYSREELQQMMAELDANDDDDIEYVEVKDDKSGRTVRFRGKRARSIVDEIFGSPSTGKSDDESDSEEVEQETPAKTRTSQKYFGSKKSAE